MKIRPLKNKVLLKPEEVKEQKIGNLYIPDTAQEKKTIGEIIAVGPEVEGIKAKDSVLYSKYSGTEVELDGEKYIILEEDDIIAIIEK